MEGGGGRPFGGSRITSGDLNTYLDISKIPGCKVSYQSPSKGGMDHSRPLWRNSNNPFQYDRNYMARGDIARGKAAHEQTKDRLFSASTAAATPLSMTGWSQVFSGQETGSIMTRRCSSASASMQRSFRTKAAGGANVTARLQGGERAASHGSSAHIPGYKGFLPGFHTYNQDIVLGLPFGQATASNDHFRATGRRDKIGKPAAWVNVSQEATADL
jgi:hypothetical protein